MGDLVAPNLIRHSGSPPPFHAASQPWRGSLPDATHFLPEFERRPFGEAGRAASGAPHLDVILRSASADTGLFEVPVGVVTRRYPLVTHQRVVQAIERALAAARISPAAVQAQIELCDFGAGMALSIDLPGAVHFSADGEVLRLRLHCLNALNGGGLRWMMSWHRAASDTQIAVGSTRLEHRLAHRLPARVSDLVPAVQKALQRARSEIADLKEWQHRLIGRRQLARWADGPVRRMWGPRDAARVFHIAVSGWDALPAFGFERTLPSRRTMRSTRELPPAARCVESAYDALWVLAWLAQGGGGAQERFDRQVEAAVLMRALLGQQDGR
jgi:hypothetical protein